MRLDMDLVREVLLQIEEFPFDNQWHDITFGGHTEEEINYHVMLLNEAGFIEAIRLTYSGHEFLDAARSSTVWTKTKTWTLKTTGTLHVGRSEDRSSAYRQDAHRKGRPLK